MDHKFHWGEEIWKKDLGKFSESKRVAFAGAMVKCPHCGKRQTGPMDAECNGCGKQIKKGEWLR